MADTAESSGPVSAPTEPGAGPRGPRAPLQLPTRNGHGTMGQQIKCYGNSFGITFQPKEEIYLFHTDITPEVESRGTRNRLIASIGDKLGVYVYDGGALLFLRQQPSVTEFDVKHNDVDHKVVIKGARTLAPGSDELLMLGNIIMRKIIRVHLAMQVVGRNYFYPDNAVDVEGYNMELWPGYTTSITKAEGGLMVVIDIVYKIIHRDTVLDVFNQTRQNSRNPQFLRRDIEKEVLNTIVMTRYNNRTYSVAGVEWDMSPKSTFERNGAPVSFAEYYEKQYEKKITDPDQPLLKSIIKRRGVPDQTVYLVPELCHLTGLGESMRANFRLMKAVADITCVPAGQRRTRLIKFVETMLAKEDVRADLNAWDMSISSELVATKAYVLPQEVILFAQNRKVSVSPTAEWAGGMRNARLLEPASLEKWVFIYSQRSERTAIEFAQTLQRVAGPLGTTMARPTAVPLAQDSTENYVRALAGNLNPSIQLVVCLLPNIRKDRYDAIKQQCILKDRTPVPSQCIVEKTLRKNVMSVCTKLILQINAKRGGQLWAVEVPFTQRVMVVGIDVCHTRGKRSAVGLCASLNRTFTRYYTVCDFQNQKQEIVDSLHNCFSEVLHAFGNLYKALPDRIIIYRDGVGRGQLPAVVNFEIPSMLNAYKRFGENYKPATTVISVQKRISTRLFVDHGNGNPPPGTVVDSVISAGVGYDFFLVSQFTRIGTVAPAHYNIIYDSEPRLKPEHIQALTYKLTHLYYNWQGTIAVPAPVQYAHKMAFLHGQSVFDGAHNVLKDKLYYL